MASRAGVRRVRRWPLEHWAPLEAEELQLVEGEVEDVQAVQVAPIAANAHHGGVPVYVHSTRNEGI